MPLTRAESARACRVTAATYVFALACDPDERAAQIHLRLGAGEAATDETRHRAARGTEPLQPGETVSLRWQPPVGGRAC